jgi:precorrin-3B synthase
MSAPVVRGWCPGALRPMQSGDGLLVRVRPHLGRLMPEQAARIAELSRLYGNGQIDLSTRANLQLRGVTPESHDPLIEGLRKLGLIDESVAVESRRNVVLAPFWSEHDDGYAVARALVAALAGPEAPKLPGKFGFAVDCGERPVLTEVSADIRIERGGDGGLICRADTLAQGRPVTRETAATVALDLARWFVASGSAASVSRRMAHHLAKGNAPPDIWRRVPVVSPDATPPMPGICAQGLLVALAFGRVAAETLAALAAVGPLRLTPWRMLLIEGAREAAMGPEVIVDRDDPRLRVTACTGGPDCLQGLSTVRPLAEALAPAVPRGRTLHVSGCAKGCAHPGAADVTLVATAPDRFDLIRNGCASDSPVRSGLSSADLTRIPAILTETFPMPRIYETDGAKIYAESFATIRAEADLDRFSRDEEPVVVRMIHAAGMVGLERYVRFSPRMVEVARAALAAGAPILCDARMVSEGITRPRLPADNVVICTLSDPRVPEMAAAMGTTRSAAALELWRPHLAGAVVAIGNAPTALFHLLEMLEEPGCPRPAAIIGCPVGFVGAAESKAALIAALPAPAMVVEGRLGGSAITVAAVNALASRKE